MEKPKASTLFQHAFCINLDRRPDRWSEAKRQFDENGVDVIRWSAVDGSLLADSEVDGFEYYDKRVESKKGALGCLRSHREVFEHVLTHEFDPVAVFEDDVLFCPNAVDVFYQWYSEFPPDWDMILLGCQGVGEKKISEHVVRLRGANFSQAVIYRRRVLQALIDVFKQEQNTIDHVWNEVIPHIKCFRVDPMLAIQAPGYSDLRLRKTCIITRYDVDMWRTVDPRQPNYLDYVLRSRIRKARDK